MTPGETEHSASRAAQLLYQAAGAAKCRPCGCAHQAAAAAQNTLPQQPELAAAAEKLRASLVEERYDCLGCPVCWPAQALGILTDAEFLPEDGHAPGCPTDDAAERAGWPPLAGAYQVLRWRAPVAVCTLTDTALAEAMAHAAGPEVSIVGTMATENLGMERLVRNVVANPNLRFVIVAGSENRQTVGHLPGASLMALAAHGVDHAGRIVNAPGRRPYLRNVSGEEIAHFRAHVEVIDLIGTTDIGAISQAATTCAARNPGPAQPLAARPLVEPTAGYLTPRMVLDPAGYFVIYPDAVHRLLVLEHYSNDGVLDSVIEGSTAAECYTPAIDLSLVTRLDHAAYLGRELARAEASLVSGAPFIQDRAPELVEPTSAGCAREAPAATTPGPAEETAPMKTRR